MEQEPYRYIINTYTVILYIQYTVYIYICTPHDRLNTFNNGIYENTILMNVVFFSSNLSKNGSRPIS